MQQMSEWLEIYVRTMLIDINEINEENKRINYFKHICLLFRNAS